MKEDEEMSLNSSEQALLTAIKKNHRQAEY